MQCLAAALSRRKGEQGMLTGGTHGHKSCADPVRGPETDTDDMAREKSSHKPDPNSAKSTSTLLFRVQHKNRNTCNNFLLIFKEIAKNLLL